MKLKMNAFDKATWIILALSATYIAWQVLRVIIQ